jgi:hypothetical protein
MDKNFANFYSFLTKFMRTKSEEKSKELTWLQSLVKKLAIEKIVFGFLVNKSSIQSVTQPFLKI